MCGRVNTYNKESIYDLMRMYTDSVLDHFDSRYNVSPGAALPVLYHQDSHRSVAMHWGLVPLWAKPGTFSRPLINARAETVFEKPSFRSLMKQQRCVISVNGFYEWQRPAEEGAKKAPYYFMPTQGEVLLLGGLYQFNKQGEAECCVITTGANSVMSPVHHRMPVLLDQDSVDDWVSSDDRSLIEDMMTSAPDDRMRTYPVDPYVSRASNDGERCIQAVV